jgi:hypothetical protein
MRIVFGMQLDGTIWSNENASIGEVRTGPMGLLTFWKHDLESVCNRYIQYIE